MPPWSQPVHQAEKQRRFQNAQFRSVLRLILKGALLDLLVKQTDVCNLVVYAKIPAIHKIVPEIVYRQELLAGNLRSALMNEVLKFRSVRSALQVLK